MLAYSSELEFSLFIIAIIANISLAATVLRFAPKNKSRYFFCFFVIAQIFWITVNFYSFRVVGQTHLSLARLTLFTSPFHSFSFFLFIKTFLSEKNGFKKKYLIPLLVGMVLVSVLTLTPYVLQTEIINEAGKATAVFAKTAGLYLAYIFICIGGGFVSLIRKFRKSKDIEHKQWSFLLLGLALTFLLLLLFSLLNPLLFGNISTVRFGHLFTLPFVLFTAYAMVRHRLMNLKAMVAELAVILLNLLLLVKFITSEDLNQFVVNGFVLVGSFIVGILLVKGVYREIRQREQLEVLTKELEAANEKLKALDQARADFISIASHQLRTPPATIKWYVAAILSGDYGDMSQDVKDQLQKVMVTNNAQISLIDDMLNASRIERGKMEFLFEETSIEELAKITYDQMVPLAKMKNLELQYEPPKEPLPKVMADKEKIRQVINNFIDNSIKYTKEGKISLRVFKDQDNVRVEVSDTGKGIAPELANSLFEKYNRGKDSVTHAQGLGLGLYVCKIVVEKNNGKVWAESPGEGKGSTFIFTLPIHNTLKATTSLDLAGEQVVK